MAESTNRAIIKQPADRRASPWTWVILTIVLLPLLAFVIFAVVTVGGVVRTWHAVDNLMQGRPVMNTEQPAVITQIQQLNRLETASFTVEKVIEGGNDRGNPVLNTLLGDRLLFIAHGEVIAGVDFGQLAESDIIVDKQSGHVSLRLPPARILSHSLNNELSRVYDRQVGLFSKGDPQLESQVRETADREVLNAACEGGILAQANGNAQTQVRALLLSVGVEQVDFLDSPRATDTGC